MPVDKSTVEDLEFNKFVEVPDGIAVRVYSDGTSGGPTNKYTRLDLEYKKFIETTDGVAVRVYNVGNPLWHETPPVENDSTGSIVIELEPETEIAKIKMYTKRVSDVETRMGYQEFFLVLNNGLWEMHDNYYVTIMTGWDGLTFSVSTNAEGKPVLSYTANEMPGVYDESQSWIKYQVEEVK